MDCSNRTEASVTASELLLRAALLIPISHYLLGVLLLFLIILYNFLEFHLFEELLVGFRGSRVSLTYNSCSELYEGVVSKCRILHGRYFATPWLSSPHFQTAFLNFFGRPPVFSYRRQLYSVADGGTIALDWLMCSDVSGGDFHISNSISKDDTTPIVVVVPGLTSDSASAYIKHVAFKMAKRGWNVVVTNHRGLGGISITSDCFYNAGWTEDLREVLDYLHREYSEAPLFAIGTSIGANVLVKYLGEDGDRTPIAGAVSICSPWDLLICDRFICRRLVQKLYDRALTIGLQGYAKLHQNALTRLANWEGIEKSRSVRDFDNHATCLVGKFETVDTYYRRSSSSTFVGNVSVPLLCISALDDPVCTREAIPWDECRANKNIVLATTQHGGHLAFFEGIAANSLWWVRAVDEFFNVLHTSPFMHKQKKTQNLSPKFSQEPSIDQGPYLNVTEDGMVIALGKELTTNDMVEDLGNEDIVQEKNPELMVEDKKPNIDKQSDQNAEYLGDITAPVKSCINQLSRQNKRSMWLLAYIAIITTWPVVGSVLLSVFRKKLKNVITPAWLRR